MEVWREEKKILLKWRDRGGGWRNEAEKEERGNEEKKEGKEGSKGHKETKRREEEWREKRKQTRASVGFCGGWRGKTRERRRGTGGMVEGVRG